MAMAIAMTMAMAMTTTMTTARATAMAVTMAMTITMVMDGDDFRRSRRSRARSPARRSVPIPGHLRRLLAVLRRLPVLQTDLGEEHVPSKVVFFGFVIFFGFVVFSGILQTDLVFFVFFGFVVFLFVFATAIAFSRSGMAGRHATRASFVALEPKWLRWEGMCGDEVKAR